MRASSPAHGLTPSQRARINIEAVGQGLAVRNLSKSIEFKWFYSVSIAFCRRDKGLLKLLPATYQMLAHSSRHCTDGLVRTSDVNILNMMTKTMSRAIRTIF
jgi:hypothetical protein